MSIRDIQYYSWETIDTSNVQGETNEGIEDVRGYAVTADISGNIYWAHRRKNWLRTPTPRYEIVVKKRGPNESEFSEVASLTGAVNNSRTEISDMYVSPHQPDRIYVTGQGAPSSNNAEWNVFRSVDSGQTWNLIFASGNQDTNLITQDCKAVTSRYDALNNILTYWVCGYIQDTVNTKFNWIVGSFSNLTSISQSMTLRDRYEGPASNLGAAAHDIAVDDALNDIYVTGIEEISSNTYRHIIRRSTNGGGTWQTVYSSFLPPGGPGGGSGQLEASPAKTSIVVDSNGGIWSSFGYFQGSYRTLAFAYSPDGSSGSFNVITGSGEFGFPLSAGGGTGGGRVMRTSIDSKNNLYTVWASGNFGGSPPWRVMRYTSGSTIQSSGNFEIVDVNFDKNVGNCIAGNIFVDPKDNVYTVGFQFSTTSIPTTWVRKGKLTANSASIGPRMLATSFGYTVAPDAQNSGSSVEKFKLNNISEFPYSAGAFQMRNLIIGTTDSGRLGTDEDAIVQVNYFGSVVHVMWPDQGSDDVVSIKGFGDFSAGQKPGKLTTNFVPGTTIDVKDYDHLTLYCYLRKESSGSLDSVELIVERKPLRDVPFTTEQAVEYESSGSYTTANLTDLRYKKVINYGDLSISEIGFPVDVPLENVKQIRISAKQTNGQSLDENKNLIVWGRFIKSEEET